ncbi:SPW repeat protein [Halosimplex halophilum]|uniref:SPW repeat protein n=1 Tax=Halosimplex halophilum TaxID=2559572 RepID=UPI00107F8A0D|nr:SPW repeat protein [Halosimplex halophilum]
MSDSEVYDQQEQREDDHDRREVDTNPTEAGKWVSALVALLGLWMLAEAFILNPVAGNFWSDIIVGAALVVLGGYNFYRRSNEQLGSVGVGAFVALLGLWLIATPFILGSTEGFAAVETDLEFWNDIVVGLLVFVLGAYSAYEARDTDVATPTART